MAREITPRVPRVVHLTTVHRATDVRIFHKECRTLANAGYEVILVAPNVPDSVIGNVTIRGVQVPTGRWLRMTIGAWRTYRKAKTLGADVYHLHDTELLPFGRLLRGRRCAVVFDMHEDLPAAILTKPWIPRLMRDAIAKLVALLERPLMRGMAVIFAERSYADRYGWVKNATDVLNLPLVGALSAAQEGVDVRDIPTVGYLGTVEEVRGSLTMLNAIQILNARYGAVAWECVGPLTSSHRRELEAHVNDHALLHVRFHGYQSPERSWQLMASCHVGLAVLQDHPNYVTSYPTKLFEYMGLGLPVVVSDFPLWREVVEGAQCGLFVEPDRPDQLAKAIQYLLEHRGEARAMGARGRNAVLEKYSWRSEADKLLALYRMQVRSDADA